MIALPRRGRQLSGRYEWPRVAGVARVAPPSREKEARDEEVNGRASPGTTPVPWVRRGSGGGWRTLEGGEEDHHCSVPCGRSLPSRVLVHLQVQHRGRHLH